ncbi:MAG: type II secretion system protein GspJ [Gemmatimonadaceae bacterium]
MTADQPVRADQWGQSRRKMVRAELLVRADQWGQSRRKMVRAKQPVRADQWGQSRRKMVRLTKRGFTLMEVMTAITVTALVATFAASALRAGMDVRERVQQHRLTIDAEARATRWISSMLRHPPAANAVSEPIFSITRSNDGREVTTFLSQGVNALAGTGPIWRVTLSVQNDGMHIRAQTVNAADASVPMESVLPHVSQFTIEALDVKSWRNDWPVLRTMPVAVRLTLGLRDGTVRGPMLFPVAPLAVASQ